MLIYYSPSICTYGLVTSISLHMKKYMCTWKLIPCKFVGLKGTTGLRLGFCFFVFFTQTLFSCKIFCCLVAEISDVTSTFYDYESFQAT